MNSSTTNPLILHADREHAGLRAAILGILILSFSLFFLILSGLIQQLDSLVAEYYWILSCFGALALAVGSAGITEYLLKQRWHSGRQLRIDVDSLEARLAGREVVRLDWSKRFWSMNWFFRLRGYPRGGRERRVPASHTCVASQLQQDDGRFIVYTFMSQAQTEKLFEISEFYEIRPAEHYERSLLSRVKPSTDRPQIPTKVLAGNEGPYWLAERRRWDEGLELEPDDFFQLINLVEEKLANLDKE